MPGDEAPTIHVFFDYTCPYAYIGKHRADRLEREYDVEINYLPWEIHPSAFPEGRVIDYDPPEASTNYLERLADEEFLTREEAAEELLRAGLDAYSTTVDDEEDPDYVEGFDNQFDTAAGDPDFDDEL